MIAIKKDSEKVFKLMNDPMPPLKSVLSLKIEGLSRIILEAVTSRVANKISDISRFIRSTLMFVQCKEDATFESQNKAIEFLLENNFISKNKPITLKKKADLYSEMQKTLLSTPTNLLSKEDRNNKIRLLKKQWKNKNDAFETPETIFPTQFGNATFFSGLNPKEAIIIKKSLIKARSSLVLKGSLHICYLVTPVNYVSVEPNWTFFYQIFSTLSPVFRKTAEQIGIDEAFLCQSSFSPPRYQSDDPKAIVHRRFFLSLLLFEIVNETALPQICARFGVERGKLQALQNSTSSFASMVAMFCQRLNWTNLASLISHFCERIGFGVQGELLPLIQIPHVKAFRARALYDSGLRSVEKVADSSLLEVKKAITKYDSYSLKTGGDCGQRRYREEVELQTAALIQKGAKKILEEQLEKLENEAATLIELGQLEERLNQHKNRSLFKDEELEEMNNLYEDVFE